MMSSVDRFVKAAARFALHRAGALHLVRYARRSALRIVTYHRFPDGCDTALAAQCEYLRRYYHPVSLSNVADWLEGRFTLPPNAVAVTIDDGYRDFLYAQQVFSKYRIPTTVFLVTGFVDGHWLWFDRLEYLIRNTHAPLLTVPRGDGSTAAYPLGSDQNCDTAVAAATEDLKTLPDQKLRRLLDALPGELCVQLPSRPARSASLSWDEIRSLRQQGVEFGAHTATHPILSRVETEQALISEIDAPKQRFRDELGEAPSLFCYPNGQPADFDDRVVRTVRAADYRMAVTTQLGLNAEGCDRYRLRRLWVDACPPDRVFKELLAGVHGGASVSTA
jgi:peptidoglycan/xylan/chitin deacetylase (PgdA/CDA1 family)